VQNTSFCFQEVTMGKGRRWPFLALVTAGGLLVLALAARPSAAPISAAAPSASAPTVLVEALVGHISKLNPLLATYNPPDRDITSLIFEGLTTTDQYGEIVPDLAESWTVSPDGLDYFVTLRGDVLWQDGVPFSADDVVYTFGVLGDPDFPGAAVLSDFWKTVEIDALSDTLVRFRLTQPLASFPDQLRMGIVPAHVLSGLPVAELEHHAFNLAPIGTGPYQIEALTASDGAIDGIQLRVAPVYRQRPEGADGYALDRIVFRTYPSAEAALDAYRRGEVNSIGSIPLDQQAAAAQLPGLSLYTTVAPRVGVLMFNWERDTMRWVRNPRARLALAHAFDRVGLVTHYLAGYGIVADSPLPPTSWAYEPGLAWPAYDLAEAQVLFETVNLAAETPSEGSAGEGAATDAAPTPAPEETSGEGENAAPPAEGEATPEPTAAPEPPGLTILVIDSPALTGLAGDIATAWSQLGLRVYVEPVSADALQPRLEAGDFDAAIVELSFEPSADPDPYVFWHQGQRESGQNYGGMDDRRVSEELELARRDPYGINRIAHYRRFQELFAERVPALVLYYPFYVYGADERLQGVQLGALASPSDRFRTLKAWTFAAE
jgi:peptide/nickel transport system substrate-binding protein